MKGSHTYSKKRVNIPKRTCLKKKKNKSMRYPNNLRKYYSAL